MTNAQHSDESAGYVIVGAGAAGIRSFCSRPVDRTARRQ